MLDNNYNESLKKAYIAKQEDDIDTINDFCEAYNEKLGVQEIADLLKLFNGQASTNEQNEFIVNMLDSIVKKEKQKAVNEIIEQSGILFQERATKCISLILTMIIFWNRDLDISLSESLAAAPNSIKDLYKKALEKKLLFMKGHNVQLIETILKKGIVQKKKWTNVVLHSFFCMNSVQSAIPRYSFKKRQNMRSCLFVYFSNTPN